MHLYLLATSINRALFAVTGGANVNTGTDCVNTADPSTCATYNTGLPKVDANSGTLNTALSIFFGALAAIAVLMIIITALRMIVNAGEPENVKRLRRTLTYAAVGLILALTADAIVGFVLGKL
ncbi:MAG TPA: pilin [Candidatus Saccharimonadales bacterium]|nr:pilin [Candidatus Saccharimonadales bacterium]